MDLSFDDQDVGSRYRHLSENAPASWRSQPCGQHCWITSSWKRPHEKLPAEPIAEHPPASAETLRDVSENLYGSIHFWQFRVLQLLPSQDVNALMKCKLLVADMVHLNMVALRDEGTTIEYEALSYSWGNPDFTVSIECNGMMVPVTRHLAEALRHLRLANTSRYIWTDALCIDQYDLVEKGQQVQLMYSSKVITVSGGRQITNVLAIS